MCSGTTVCGNSTKFGRGKIGTGSFGGSIMLRLSCPAAPGRRRRSRSVVRDELQQILNVPVDLHLGIDLRDASGLVDDERRALDSHVLLAVQILLFVHAEHLGHRRVFVHEQRERQFVLLDEVLVRFEIVRRDAEDHGVVLLELRGVVAEVARFARATGSLVLGIEVEDDGLLPFVLLERDVLARRRRQREIRCGSADDRQQAGRHASSESGAGLLAEPGVEGRPWRPGTNGNYLLWTADMARARSRFCSTTPQSRLLKNASMYFARRRP